MQESLTLVQTLKKILRSKGITYLEIANSLEISEASVKRIFSEGSFTLERFERICLFADVSITEVAELSRADKTVFSHTYTTEQEKYFADNPKCLAFFDLLIRLGSIEKVRNYKPDLTDTRINKYLRQLDKMGLIERHPGDRISFPVSRSVNWQKNGPLGRKFRAMAKTDFIMSNEFVGDGCFYELLGLELTQKSANLMAEKLLELATEIKHTATLEQKVKAKTRHYGFLVAQRPWKLEMLEDC